MIKTLFRFLIFGIIFSSVNCLITYEFPDPIEHYRDCGLTKPGRFCDPKSVLTTNERNQANDALMEAPVNVFAFLDHSRLINASDPDNLTHITIDVLHTNISRVCQRHASDCSQGPSLFVIEFIKMPADAVGGERFDISYTDGAGPIDQHLKMTFDKALDSSMPDFTKLNLTSGLTKFGQSFSEIYGKSASTGWTAATYPNPCLSPAQCGMNDPKDVFLCDPDSVLKSEQRQKVNAEFRSAGQGNILYAAIGEPITGDLDSFAKTILSNWSTECVKHGRPKPFGLVVVHVAPQGSDDKNFMKSSSLSDGAGFNAMVRYVMESEGGMASISDRLVNVVRRVNESWDGQHFRDITLATTVGPNVTTLGGPRSGCADNFRFRWIFVGFLTALFLFCKN